MFGEMQVVEFGWGVYWVGVDFKGFICMYVEGFGRFSQRGNGELLREVIRVEYEWC